MPFPRLTSLFVVLLLQPVFCDSLQTIPVGPLQANCYIVVARQGNSAVVMDPGDEPERILAAVTTARLNVRAILITHAHADHLGACQALREATCASVWIHAGDLQAARGLCPDMPFNTFAEDGTWKTDGFEFEIIHTPGHTPGSVCIRSGQRLFSGDTLFLEGVGKSDDPEQLRASIRERLWVLPDATEVFPGHGPPTSIGFEKRHNPYVGDEAPAGGPALDWLEDRAAATDQAKTEGKPLLLFLTVQAWPCARGYCDRVMSDSGVVRRARGMVRCRIDLGTSPEVAAEYGIDHMPSNLPAVAIHDASGALLDILEHPSADALATTLDAILAGERPLERYRALEVKKARTGEEYLEMARYLRNHGRLEEAILRLEEGRAVRDLAPPQALDIRKTLLAAYMDADDNEAALSLAESLLAHPVELERRDMAELQLKECILHYRQEDYPRVRELAENFIAQYGDDFETDHIILLEGLAWLAEGEYDRAFERFEAAHSAGRETIAAKALYLQGYCRLVQQDYTAAYNAFVQLPRDYPDSTYARKAADYALKLEENRSAERVSP